MASSSEGRVLKRANPNTIQGKFLVGYQGWFTCGGDGPPVHKGHHGWLHWFNKPLPDGGNPTFDLWPDVSSYTPSELFPVPGLTLPDGSQALLFSSRHPLTVRRHFHWMAQHAVDGVFYQRFASQCEADGRTTGALADLTRLRDEVLDRVRESAEAEGRVWAVMYDVSGVSDERVEKVIKADWTHLMCDKRILESPFYLKEGGRPVIALWGFGFAGRNHKPGTVRSVVQYIRSVTPGGAYIVAGTPTHWRTLQGDADPNPDFLSVWYTQFDAISPWTVGRFGNEESIDRFAREKLLPDVSALQDPRNTHGRKVDYIPVIFPGGSGFNMTNGRWGLNAQPRDGGRFLWRQIYHVLRTAGAKIVYGAMWDEYDEGTAFLPAASKKRQLPVEEKFIALDADGYDLPPDWYMRIAGFAGEMIRGERQLHEPFPVKDLQDYWSSRPKYELITYPSNTHSQLSSEPIASGSGNSNNNEGVTQTFEEWCEQEKDNINDLPPPPYTLEVDPASDAAQTEQQQPESQNQRNEENEGDDRPSVVPVQTRPDSVSVHDSGRPEVPLASRPSVTASALGSDAGYGPTRPPEVPLASRPVPSGVGEGSQPLSQQNQAFHVHQGYAPMYVTASHIGSNPSESISAPAIQTQSYYPPNSGEQGQPPSMSSLTDQFGRQTLNGGILNSSIPPSNFTSTSSAGPSAFPQWPPAEWGVASSNNQQQTYPISSPPPRPPSSSRPPPPPVHPARPGSRPPPSPGTSSTSSIPNSPLTPGFGLGVGGGFGRPGSTSPQPSASSSVIPGPGSGSGYGPGIGGAGGFGGTMPSSGISPPLPTTAGGISFPHAHASPSISASASTGSNSSTSEMAFPNAYPDVTQGYVGNVMQFPSFVPGVGPGSSSGAGYGPGGFYMGSGHGSSPGPATGSGSGYPPSHPPYHPPPPPRRYDQPRPPPPPPHPSLHTHHQQSYGNSYSQYPGFGSASPHGNGAGSGPGGMYPPHIPTRQSTSPSPSLSSSHLPSQPATVPPNSGAPGGFISGPGPGPGSGPSSSRFAIPETYKSTLGAAVDKFAGAGTRKKIEGGIESLSSAGSKVYQKFKPGS